MQYLLLIYTSEPTEDTSPDLMRAESAEYAAFSRWLIERGQFKGGEALHPTTAATTVQVRDGRTITTDGPYAETKEALGGFYLIDAKDLDEAIDAAARIPGARHGFIEIRPILELPTMTTSGPADEALASAG
ncbi:MAG TPA: YciI family protein [Candidatus Limnocylindrales bacterium]|jgi:hypothetical protein